MPTSQQPNIFAKKLAVAFPTLSRGPCFHVNFQSLWHETNDFSCLTASNYATAVIRYHRLKRQRTEACLSPERLAPKRMAPICSFQSFFPSSASVTRFPCKIHRFSSYSSRSLSCSIELIIFPSKSSPFEIGPGLAVPTSPPPNN